MPLTRSRHLKGRRHPRSRALFGANESIDPLVERLLVSDMDVQIVRTAGIGTPRQPSHGVYIGGAALSQFRKEALLSPDRVEHGGTIPVTIPRGPASEQVLVHDAHWVVGGHGRA